MERTPRQEIVEIAAATARSDRRCTVLWHGNPRQSETGADRIAFRGLGSFRGSDDNVLAIETTLWWGVR